MSRDDALLVRRHHPNRYCRRGGVYSSIADPVQLIVDRGTQPRASQDDFPPGPGVSLTDAPCEHQPVQTAEGGRKRADLPNDAVDEEFDGFPGVRLSGLSERSHVRGYSRDAQKSGFL